MDNIMEAQKLNDFLKSHKTQKGEEHTHTRIGGKEGDKIIYPSSYCIKGDDLVEFHKLYINAVVKGGVKEYLTEKPLKESLINFDFDFRYNTDINERQHNQEHIEYIVYGLANGIKEICNETPNNYEIAVLEKDHVIKEETKTKDGIHILVGLRANSNEKLEIRNHLINYLERAETFKNLPLTNHINDVVDKCVLTEKQMWIMPYSQKPNNIPYKITNIYNVENNNNDDIELDPLDIDSYNKEELFYKWTIHNEEPTIIKTNIEYSPINKKPIEKKTYKKIDDETFTQLIECLNPSRAEDSDDWRIIGACIYNEKGEEGLPYFIEFSRKSKIHNDSDDEIEDLYNNKIRKYAQYYNYTIGTIKYYAKIDNELKYSEITHKNVYCEKWTAYDWGLYLCKELKYKLKYSIKKWFICIDNLWQIAETPTYLCVGEMKKLLKINFTRLVDITDDDIRKQLNKTLMAMSKQIDTTSFNSQLKEHLKILCLDDDFINKLYSHQEKLIFKNGIVDMRTGKLNTNQILAEDYIPEELKINWEFKNETNEENKRFIKEKLLQIHNNNQEQLDWILRVYGYALSGIMKEQIMVNIKGISASNGKTTITEVLKNILPTLVMYLPSEILNLNYTKRHKFLGDIYGKRIIQFEELPKDKKIDTQFLKKITDGSIQNEVMFGTNTEINILATLFSNTNHTPNLDVDEGLKRRYKECNTNNKFHKKDDYERLKKEGKLKPTDYLADNNLKEKLINMKNEFIHILIEGYKDYVKEGKLKEPSFITEQINETIKSNNELSELFEENFEITNYKYDIIHKQELCSLCKITSEREFKDFRQLKGLNYDSQLRSKGLKGFIIGIRRIQNEDNNNELDNEED